MLAILIICMARVLASDIPQTKFIVNLEKYQHHAATATKKLLFYSTSSKLSGAARRDRSEKSAIEITRISFIFVFVYNGGTKTA